MYSSPHAFNTIWFLSKLASIGGGTTNSNSFMDRTGIPWPGTKRIRAGLMPPGTNLYDNAVLNVCRSSIWLCCTTNEDCKWSSSAAKPLDDSQSVSTKSKNNLAKGHRHRRFARL